MGFKCIRCPYAPSCNNCKPPQICEFTVQTCTKCSEAICVDLPHAGMTALKPILKQASGDVPTDGTNPGKFIAGRNAAIGGIIGGVFGMFILAAIIYRLVFWTPKGLKKKTKPPDVDFQSVAQRGGYENQLTSLTGEVKSEANRKSLKNGTSRMRKHREFGVLPILEEAKDSSTSGETTMESAKFSPTSQKSNYDTQQQALIMRKIPHVHDDKQLDDVIDGTVRDDETIELSPALFQQDRTSTDRKGIIKNFKKRTSSIFSHSFADALIPRNRTSYFETESQELRSSKVNRIFQKLLITRDSQNRQSADLDDDFLNYIGQKKTVNSVAPKIPSLKLHHSKFFLPFSISKMNILKDESDMPEISKINSENTDMLPELPNLEQGAFQQSEEEKNDQESVISEGALQYLRTHPSLTDVGNTSHLTQKASLFSKPSPIAEPPSMSDVTLENSKDFSKQDTDHSSNEQFSSETSNSRSLNDLHPSTTLRYSGVDPPVQSGQTKQFSSIVGEKSLAGYAETLNKAGAPTAHTAHRSAAFENKRPVDVQRERMRKMISNRQKMLHGEYDFAKRPISNEPWQPMNEPQQHEFAESSMTEQSRPAMDISSHYEENWGDAQKPPAQNTPQRRFTGRARAYSFDDPASPTDDKSVRASGTWSSASNDQNTSDSDMEPKQSNHPDMSHRFSVLSAIPRRSRHPWKQPLETQESIQEEPSTEAQGHEAGSSRHDFYERDARYHHYQQTFEPSLSFRRDSLSRYASVTGIDEAAIEGHQRESIIPESVYPIIREPEYPAGHEMHEIARTGMSRHKIPRSTPELQSSIAELRRSTRASTVELREPPALRGSVAELQRAAELQRTMETQGIAVELQPYATLSPPVEVMHSTSDLHRSTSDLYTSDLRRSPSDLRSTSDLDRSLSTLRRTPSDLLPEPPALSTIGSTREQYIRPEQQAPAIQAPQQFHTAPLNIMKRNRDSMA